MDIRPQKIIVLSNYTIEQCFNRREDYEPLSRRFKVIQFPEGKQEATFRAQLQPSQTSPESETTNESLPILTQEDEPLLDLPTWDWSGLFDEGHLSPML